MAKRKSWAARIEAAEARGGFTEWDKQDAVAWNTCAVGEKHNFVPERIVILTRTTQEYEKGLEFCGAVCDDDIPAAKRLYAEIMALL